MRPMAGSIGWRVLSPRHCSLGSAGGRLKFTASTAVGHNASDAACAGPTLYESLLAQRRGRPARR